jgi:hypothetical protein
MLGSFVLGSSGWLIFGLEYWLHIGSLDWLAVASDGQAIDGVHGISSTSEFSGV